MAIRAIAVAAAGALLLLGLSARTACAQTPGLVVDVQSGNVLFAERATDPWFPASITKLMTVYVALEMVKSGRVSMNSLMTMTEEAAAMPPSKLGLKPGQGLTLENAIKVIMVKSANDVAAMIGQNLGGGSTDAFAAMMNAASRRLGMHESRWVNANGLPDDRQQTSARDMAILARALLTEFPEHADLFRIGALRLGREVMRNHNGLLGRYPGIDGMKTGFICAGGFNIVATSSQGGRRLIAVVMGYPSAKERDLRTADLLDQGFSSSGFFGGQSLDSLPPSSSVAPQNMRQIICGPKRRQPQEDDEPAALASGNAENPIAAFFSPNAAAATVPGTAVLSARRDLGPRVAFEPEQIWIGAQPGEVADTAPAGGSPRVAGTRRVRTRVVGRGAAPGPAARALTAPGATPSIATDTDTVKTSRRPASAAALRDNLAAKPAAEARPRHGAIVAKNASAADDDKPAAKPKGKPKPKPSDE